MESVPTLVSVGIELKVGHPAGVTELVSVENTDPSGVRNIASVRERKTQYVFHRQGSTWKKKLAKMERSGQ